MKFSNLNAILQTNEQLSGLNELLKKEIKELKKELEETKKQFNIRQEKYIELAEKYGICRRNNNTILVELAKYKKLYEELKKLSYGNGFECPESILGDGYDSITDIANKDINKKCKDCHKCFEYNFKKWEGEILNGYIKIYKLLVESTTFNFDITGG